MVKSFNLKRVAIVLVIAIPVVTFPMWVFRVFPQRWEWCVRANPNGQTRTLPGADCWRKG